MIARVRASLVAIACVLIVAPSTTHAAGEYQWNPPTTRRGSETGGPATTLDGRLVYRRGRLTTGGSYAAFDFDAGRIAGSDLYPDLRLGDFQYVRGAWTQPARFASTGSARVWPGGGTPRGLAGCNAVRATPNAALGMMVPSVGQYACFVTGEGRVGELRFDVLKPFPSAGGDVYMTASYTTWK